MPDSALPPNLQGKRHWDYPWPLKWVPRAWTSFKWGKPKKVFGNQADVKPIGDRGTWQVSRYPDGPWWAWYFAFTTSGGLHFRVGARYDDVDDYTDFPSIAVKRGVGGPS